VKWSNLTKKKAKIFIFHLVNFDYFLVKSDYSLVAFTYLSYYSYYYYSLVAIQVVIYILLLEMFKN